jgi:hypothetical protein
MFALLLGGLELLFLFLFPFSLLFMAFWIWMLIDCIRSKGLSDGEKIAWTLVIVSRTRSARSFIFWRAGRGQLIKSAND